MNKLKYVRDDSPGIQRLKRGKSFCYVGRSGARISTVTTIQRIQALAIPPAWKDVWICPAPDGYIQATGRDQRGRKQYRYHALWNEKQSHAKFDRMLEFGNALPRLRRTLSRDLKRRGLERDKVLASIVTLLQHTLIRVGNEEYARTNKSFGLTTLRNSHAKVKGKTVTFRFRGKSGVWHDVDIDNKQLAKCVRNCQELPGQQLFEYRAENGRPRKLSSSDVNGYLREKMRGEFGAKDFRTWSGSVIAGTYLSKHAVPTSETARRRVVQDCVKHVAKSLRNTPATCRKFYIHPVILELFLQDKLRRAWHGRGTAKAGLSKQEMAFLRLIERYGGAGSGSWMKFSRKRT